jgi:hypothetical protein
MGRTASLIVATMIFIALVSVISVRADQPFVVVMSPGETRNDFYLTITNTGQVGFAAAARASGTAAGWVTPTTIDFGQVTPGQSRTTNNAFTMTVPASTVPGNYTLDWTYYAYNGTATQDLFVRGYIIEVVQTSSTSSMQTTSEGSGMGIPGFPLEAIVLGAFLGFGLLFVLRRR